MKDTVSFKVAECRSVAVDISSSIQWSSWGSVISVVRIPYEMYEIWFKYDAEEIRASEIDDAIKTLTRNAY